MKRFGNPFRRTRKTPTEEAWTTAEPKAAHAHPATSGTEELIKALKTDPVNGLSPKEAGKRLRHNQPGRSSAALREGALFATGGASLPDCIKKVCREPVLWLYLAVCLSALFFDRVAIGLACLVLLFVHSAACVYFTYSTAAVDGAMQTGDNPLCRVVRNGRVQRVSPDGIVRGDVLRLSAGDTVPADVRLLEASSDLVVTERELNGNMELRRPLRLAKQADALVTEADLGLHSPANMMYAGGIVESGEARALVVATGTDTHLGGLCGTLAPAHSSAAPTECKKIGKLLNIWNICLLVLVIPLVGIGIWRLGGTYDLLDIVLTVLSLCVTSLSGRLLTLYTYMAASHRHFAATDRDTENAADIKTATVLSELNRLDEIVLVGTAGLHDGILHPETLVVGKHSYDCAYPGTDELAASFAEGLYLLRLGWSQWTEEVGVANPETRRLPELFDAVCDWAETDTESIRLRVESVVSDRDGRAVTVTYKNRETVVYDLTFDAGVMTGCTLTASSRRYGPMTEEDREGLREAWRRSVADGNRVCFLISRRQGQLCMEGMLSYAPHTCRKTAGAIRSLEAAGIRVTAFLRTVSEENARILSQCGLTEMQYAHRPPREGERTPAAEARQHGYRAFEGCDTAYIAAYIQTRQKEGATVGVLSGDREDLRLLDLSDIAFTCCPGLYAATQANTAGLGRVHLAHGASCERDGTPDADCATDLCRRRADVLVRRVRPDGGGVLGIRQALLTADRFRNGLRSAWHFTLLSCVLRLLFVVVPICTGLALINAPALLLSGLCVDLWAIFSLTRPDVPATLTSRRKPATEVFPSMRPWRTDLIAAALAALMPWVIAGIGEIMAVKYGASRLEQYAFLSLLCIQLAVFMADRTLFRRTRVGLITIVALLCLWVSALAVTLGAGLRLMWTLIFPLVGGIVYVVALLIGKFIRHALGSDTQT